MDEVARVEKRILFERLLRGLQVGTMEVGLFHIIEMPEKIPANFPDCYNVIHREVIDKEVYGEEKVPLEEDFLPCPFCGGRHLRGCFEAEEPLLGTQKWVEYYIELQKGLSYSRRVVHFKEWRPDDSGWLVGPKIEWFCLSEKPLMADGWFLIYDNKLFGVEKFPTSRVFVHHGSRLVLTPRISLV